jgi:hypothetical protein
MSFSVRQLKSTVRDTRKPRWRTAVIQSERARHRSPRASTSPTSWIAAPKQQQFLSRGGFAGIRVRNDRNGAPAQTFIGWNTGMSSGR